MSKKATLARIDANSESDTTDYGIIESAVKETARGRWFLHEYARKNRRADTLAVLEAIEKLTTQTRNISSSIDTDHIRLELKEMAQAIASTRHEIGSIRSDVEQEINTANASCELDSIVSATESATSEILEAAEQVQEAAWTMREQDIDEKSCEKLDALATDIYTACSFQDITGQRTNKVIKVLQYLESRINGMSQIWGTESWTSELPNYDDRNAQAKADAHSQNAEIATFTPPNQSDIDSVLEDTAAAQEMLDPAPEVPDIFEEQPEETLTCEASEDAPQAMQPAPVRQEIEEAVEEKVEEEIEVEIEEEIEDEDEDDETESSYSDVPAAINMSSLNADDMHALFSC